MDADLWRPWSAPAHWRDADGPRPLIMLTSSFPTGPGSLAGRFVLTMAQQLAQADHRVTVVTPACAQAGPGRCIEGDVEIIRCAYAGWRRGPFHGSGLPEALVGVGGVATAAAVVPALAALLVSATRAALRSGPRALLVGHWLWPGGGLAHVAAVLAGVEATTICHSGAVRMAAALPRALSRPLMAAGLGGGPYVATCQELVSVIKAVVGAQAAERAHVAPMPVPKPQRVGVPPQKGPWRLLFMGRLVPIKGLDAFMEVLLEVGAQMCVLEVAGDGPQRAALEQKAAALGLDVRFHGVVVGQAKARLLSSCHGFVLPSLILPDGRTEGVPVSALEALSYGLPLWATRVGGVTELVDSHSLGVGCDPGVEGLCGSWSAFEALMERRWSLNDPGQWH